MEIKKSKKADLESKKPIFMQVGLVLALSLMLFGFEYKSYDKVETNDQVVTQSEVIEEVVLQTKQESKPEPPPPAQPQTTLLQIVDNNVQVDDINVDAEADETEANKEYKAVEEEVVTDAAEAEIFTVVEEAATYPGGDGELKKYLAENIKYPQMARDANLEGTVYVTFVVERDGRITDAKILRDIGGGCGDEALRVVAKMPKWQAGKQRGKSVRVQFNLPIKFTLN